MSRYDVLVVGAGPAGATAALRLAQGGARVALLERESLPRFKPCGGIVPGVVFRLLGDLDPALAEPTGLPLASIRYTFKGRDAADASLPEGTSFSVDRRDFDMRIVEAARRAGAEVLEGLAVGSVDELAEGVRVVTSTGARFEADRLIGADGGNSLIAARLGLRAPREPIAVAAEVQIARPHAEGRAHLDFGHVPGGYIGTVEKRDFLTVGLYVLGKSEARIKPAMKAFLDLHGLPEETLHARSFPVYRKNRVLETPRCLLVGDAAGIVDALSGEGIRHAVRTGRMAAEAVLDGSDYGPRVHRELGPELQLASLLARLAYTFPRIAFEGMKRVPREASLVINGEMSYRQLLDRLVARVARFGAKEPPGSAGNPSG